MKKRLKVLAVNGESDPAETGSFIEMYQRGVDITVITWPETFNYDALIAAGVPTIPYVLKGKLSVPCIRLIRNELQRRDYDVLHMLDKRATMNGLWASRGLNVKLVAYRGIIGNVSYLDPLSWFYLLNPRLDRIICVCEAIRQYLLKLGFAGIRIGRDVPVTVHKGHNPEWYSPPFENLAQFDIPEDAFVVGCTARGVPRKGVPVLLNAIDQLPDGMNIHFLLSGTNMDCKEHRRMVEKSRYRQNIHLQGFLKRMPWIVPNFDVAVLPSLKREGLSRSIIESMIGGAVPIVTDVGGSPELVEDGVSGFVVPAGESTPIAKRIVALYEDRQRHKTMSDAARKRIATHFTVERTAEETIAVYEDLIGN